MKRIFVTGVLLFLFNLVASAQIENVKIENAIVFVKNKDQAHNVQFKINKGCSLIGFSERYVVIKEANEAKIYDSGGKYRTSIELPSGTKGVKVNESEILIKDSRGFISYYDFNGNYKKKVRG
ncbi:MAG: hypothetical protein CMO01_11500 [Thalassobius sp.]|nr:hypothetical protein [Thalassovita sp.]|tara:strand:- start:217 stop:585 length:369 start_codon:yes stop_codon:yes gene_type:complete